MKLQVLGGSSSQNLVQKICPILKNPESYFLGKCLDAEILNGCPLNDLYKFKPSSLQLNTFPDGELDVKIDKNIRGDDIFIIQSTSSPVNDSLIELLLIIDAAKRASAGRITVALPYFGYSRKDRKDEGRVPISAKLIANLLTTAGADRILAIDLHAEQIQGFFDIPVDHLYAFPVLIQHLRKALTHDNNLIFVGPDLGATKLARRYAHAFKSDIALIDKRRINGEETSIQTLIGNVANKNVVLVDDIISTAGTIARSAHFLKTQGAQKIYMVATHSVICGSALEKLAEAPYEKLFITDTISNGVFADEEMCKKFRVEVVSIAKLLAVAIQHIHLNDSVSKLINFDQDNFLLL